MDSSASFLVPNLRLLLAVLGVKFAAKLTLHVQPFSLDVKPTCMQPTTYRRTQSRASLALPDYSRYFRIVRIVRQHQTSPVPSVSSSRYKQRWRSSLHDTRHPIMPRRSLVLRTSFVLRQFCSRFDGPRSCFDGPRSRFDRPRSQFDGPRSVLHLASYMRQGVVNPLLWVCQPRTSTKQS